jgi:multiple sugar transport system substrate-binding protein
MPMGVNSSDSYQVFLDFIDAYNVKLVDDNGKLTVDDPKVRQGLINSLKDFTDPYVKGCVPPSATNWKDPDNNVAFNNRSTVMTPNGTISVAAKWLNDANNEALSPAERAEAKKRYYENIRTTGYPNKPDGTPMDNRIAVKIGLVFESSKNKKRAKEFASFLLEEGNLRNYIEGGLGRWFPVIKAEQDRTFWQEDRHRKAVHAQITGPTLPYEFTKNYKFTVLNNENAWAIAANRVVNEKVPVDKAVDELIARIKRTAAETP